MSEHLTQKQGEEYCRQKLSSSELLAVSDHLDACEACRRQVDIALGGDEGFFAMQSELLGEAPGIPSAMREHPTAEQAAGYVDGLLRGDELQVVTDHLSSCLPCTLAVDDLRAFRSRIVEELDYEYNPIAVAAPAESWLKRRVASLPSLFQRSPALAFGAAFSVLLLALTTWLVWRALPAKETKQEIAGTQAGPSEGDTKPPVIAQSPAIIAQLNDGDGEVKLDQEGKVSGADNLPPAYRQMLKDALADQRLEKSPQLKGLVRPPSSLMSADKQGAGFSVIEPVGRVLLSDRPTFRWSSLDGATGYAVEVYDEGFNLVAGSSQLTGLSWTAPKPLKRGGIYSWQVTSVKDGQEIKSPRPPAPQAKFRILDSAKANELAQARRSYGSSHLALGLLYAKAGLLEEAQQEFRALEKANPDSAIARKLVADVQAMRR